MTPFSTQARFTIGLALLVPFMGSLWLLAVPNAITSTTYAVLATLLMALAAVAMNTYANGRAANSMGQLLHETETSVPVRMNPPKGPGAERLQA